VLIYLFFNYTRRFRFRFLLFVFCIENGRRAEQAQLERVKQAW